MSATNTAWLARGLTLVRHYDPEYDLAQQCGEVAYYQAIEDQLIDGSLTYYNTPAGNKLMLNVELHIYSTIVAFPPNQWNAVAVTHDLGGGKSRVEIRYLAGGSGYGWPSAISHEFGHAHRFWTECFSNPGFRDEFIRVLSSQYATNCQPYNPSKAPWGNDNYEEQYANNYRFFKGVSCTRGVSGSDNGGTDPVIPGFEDPKAHPDWNLQLDLLPELCAYMKTYGCSGGLQWRNGSFWQFRRGDGVYVAQTNYNTWWKWTSTGWVRDYPTYNRT